MFSTGLRAMACALSLMCSFSYAVCQAVLVLPSPPAGAISLYDIARIQVINNGMSESNLSLSLVLTDIRGEPVYQADYHPVALHKGANFLSLSQLSPQSQSYFHGAGSILQSTRRLPYGEYRLCVNIRKEGTNPWESDNCIDFIARPVTPPVLISPSDESVVRTPQPLLTWLPPQPLLGDRNIRYRLKLVERDSGQTSIDAIHSNPVLYYGNDLLSHTLAYPPTATPLKKGATYAWQVEAYTGTTSLGFSEVWGFKLEQEEPKTPDISKTYFQLRRYQDGSYAIAKPELQLYLPAFPSAEKATAVFSNSLGEQVKLPKKQSQVLLSAGDNYLSLPLGEWGTWIEGELYYLKVKTSAGEYAIAFKYYSSADAYANTIEAGR